MAPYFQGPDFYKEGSLFKINDWKKLPVTEMCSISFKNWTCVSKDD